MIIKGFRFGLLLQFAVGPVCLFIFQTAASLGFMSALSAVFGVALVDGLFIFLAIKGVASLISSEKAQSLLKLFGSIILIVFGLSTILGQFDINILPSLSINNALANNAFLRALLITIANPLTIIFWAGVFTTKILEDNMKQSEVYMFGAGAVLSTIIFLFLVAVIGSFTTSFLPEIAIQILNIAVGIMLIYFGIKLYIKKPT